MRTLTVTLLFLLYFTSANAQSEAETLEWINIKKGDISLGASYTNTVAVYTADTLLITKDHIRLASYKGSWTQVNWNSIKEIKEETYSVKLITSHTYNNQPLYLMLTVYSGDLRPKLLKAIKHMATLKGAKLIDSELF